LQCDKRQKAFAQIRQTRLRGALTKITGTSASPGRFRCMWTRSRLILVSLLIAAPHLAAAQSPPSPATPQQQTAPPPQRSTDCEPAQPDHSGTTAPPEGSTTGQAREALGDKLARSNGVLCPPSGVDPEMRAPAPETGRMPVIPPPGSPGGNPDVRPK